MDIDTEIQRVLTEGFPLAIGEPTERDRAIAKHFYAEGQSSKKGYPKCAKCGSVMKRDALASHVNNRREWRCPLCAKYSFDDHLLGGG